MSFDSGPLLCVDWLEYVAPAAFWSFCTAASACCAPDMSPDLTALSSDAKSLRNCVRCERRRLALSDGSEADVASALDAGYTGLVVSDEPTPEIVMTLPQLTKEVNENLPVGRSDS